MKIAYFCCHADHLPLGALSAASAKRHMPDVEIVHLTDLETAPLAGADTVMRFGTEGNFWRRRSTACAALDGDVLHVDTDVLFRRDVSEVFARPFELMLPRIRDPRWRYDAGMAFARFPTFFQAMLGSRVAQLPQADCGVEVFLREYHEYARAFVEEGSLAELPGRIYSYVPDSRDDPGIEQAAIVHYRGPRKRWMLEGWDGEPWR